MAAAVGNGRVTSGRDDDRRGPGTWWDHWRFVRVRPVHDIIMMPLGDDVLAALPEHVAVVLDDVQTLLCDDPDDGASIGELADELREAGFPTEIEVEAIVANSARSLTVARLATLSEAPDVEPPPVSIGPEQPRNDWRLPRVPGRARPLRAQRRWACCDARGISDETPDAPNEVFERGGGVRLDGCWVSGGGATVELFPESELSTIPDAAQWHAPVWIDDGGDTVVIAGATSGSSWTCVPLASVVVPLESTDSAELAAAASDLLGQHASAETRTLMTLAVRLANSRKLRPVPPRTISTLMSDIPRSLTRLDSLGVLSPQGLSSTISRGDLCTGRSSWEYQLPSRSDTTRCREVVEALHEFALPRRSAEFLVDLDDNHRQIILGIDEGTGHRPTRNKVYVQLDRGRSWDLLVTLHPELGELHQSVATLSGKAAGAPPRFVAWKRDVATGRVGFSLYREDHSGELTLADAITSVLADHQPWTAASLALTAIDRSLDSAFGGDDLEVISDDGRHSIDVVVPHASPRGARAEPARILAALAGVDTSTAADWCDGLSRQAVVRCITGIQASGLPFFSVYTR